MLTSLFVEVPFNNKPVTSQLTKAQGPIYKARVPTQFDQTTLRFPFPCPAAREEIQLHQATEASECCTRSQGGRL